MGLGDTIANGINGALTGGGSSLRGFLSKYNSSESLFVNQIDTLNTFDVTFEFWPKKGDIKEKTGWSALGDTLGNMASKAAKNALNNITGGLLGAGMNERKVTDEKKYDPSMTFIEYIARENMLTGSDGVFGGTKSAIDTQLILDLSYYIQNIQLPQIGTNDGGMAETMVGEFPLNGTYIKPAQNTIQLEVINTKAPLIERLFYPWLREVTTPIWHYEKQPYTTADVKVSFEKHMDMEYLFVNCRPSQIEALKPSNELQTPIRQVTLMFDYMFILSKLERSQSLGDAAMGLVGNLASGVGNLF